MYICIYCQGRVGYVQLLSNKPASSRRGDLVSRKIYALSFKKEWKETQSFHKVLAVNVLSCNQLFMQSSCRACYIQTCTSDTKYLQAMPPYFPQIVHFVCGAAEILYALSESRTIGSYPNFASSKGRWEKPAKGNTFHQRSNVEKESLGSSRVSPK